MRSAAFRLDPATVPARAASASGHEQRQATPGVFRRLIKAIMIARQRRAELEVGRFIERNGGRLTDDLEREISRRFGTLGR